MLLVYFEFVKVNKGPICKMVKVYFFEIEPVELSLFVGIYGWLNAC